MTQAVRCRGIIGNARYARFAEFVNGGRRRLEPQASGPCPVPPPVLCCARTKQGRGVEMALADVIIIISRSGGAFASRWLHVVVGITWIGLLYYFNFVQVPAFAEMEAAARNNAIDKLASRALWWFRWAAVATLVTGLMILAVPEERRQVAALQRRLHEVGAGHQPSPPASCSALTMFLNVWLVIWPNQKKVIANARNVQAGGEADPDGRRGGPQGVPRLAHEHDLLAHRC